MGGEIEDGYKSVDSLDELLDGFPARFPARVLEPPKEGVNLF